MEDFEENGKLEIPEKSSKTGDRFTAISDLQRMRNVFYFKQGKGSSFESFQSKFAVPRYLKYYTKTTHKVG